LPNRQRVAPLKINHHDVRDRVMEKDLATRGGHAVKGVGPAAPKADLPRDLAVPIR
jgi:hypothetical protein